MSTPPKRGENLPGAGVLFDGAFWTTYKDDAAALRIAGSRSLIRPANRNAVDGGVSVVMFVRTPAEVGASRLKHKLRFPRTIHESDGDLARARLYRNANDEARVRSVHVQLIIGIADDLSVPCQRPRQAFRLASDGKPFDQLAIDTYIELLRRAHSDDVVVNLASQSDAEFIFTVEQKLMTDREADSGPKRKLFTRSNVLFEKFPNAINVIRGNRSERRIADRQTADGSRGGKVSFEVRRREGETVGNVVESFVGFVRQKQ